MPIGTLLGVLADLEIRLAGQVPVKRVRREPFHVGRHRHAMNDNFDTLRFFEECGTGHGTPVFVP